MNDADCHLMTVFAAALEKGEPGDRAAYLDGACGHDPALRARVEALLRAHEGAGRFLEAPPADATRTSDLPPAEAAGAVVGPYRLVEPIGEGGMGTVWLARQQEPVKRLVALKVIKPGMDSRQVLARFEAERQALALMDHPHIAKVFDAGTTPSGRPYFVMELVKGTPITKYCDDHRLTPRERLGLFVQVCAAVQHAHQKGIIHRDLKPSNVLVAPYDGRPVVRVIDFGVAKAAGQPLTDKTLVTGLGAVVGTPEYMSPEQAELNNLDVDTRSDIYALGVLLYELLTGTTPLSKQRVGQAALLEVLRVIREEEPPRPSTRLSTTAELPSIAAVRGVEPAKLSKLVRGELDWIVMKALEKDRNRRYETADGLARDVERYLHDEPVLACPPSAGYRLRKFVRRHQGRVLAAAFIVLALVAGIIGTTWGLIRARAAAAAESRAKDTAEQREAETRAVLAFVEEKVFAAARPKGDWGGLGPDVKLREAIEAALPFVDTSFRDRPLIEARLRMTIGRSFLELGDAKAAIKQYEAAHAIYTQYLGPDDRLTLQSTMDLGRAYSMARRTREGIRLQEEALRRMKAVLGPEDRNTLAGSDNLASSYYVAGRIPEATTLYEETLRRDKAVLGPDDPWVGVVMMNLANAYQAAGRTQDALALREEALARMTATFGPGQLMTLNCENNLGNSYRDAGLTLAATELLEEAVRGKKAVQGPDHPGTLESVVNLALSYVRAGRGREATKLLEDAIPRAQAKLGAGHPEVLRGKFHLANCYGLAGRTPEKTKLLEEALPLFRATFGPDRRITLNVMNNLAISYRAAGLPREAVKLLEEAVPRSKAALGPDHPDTLVARQNLASVYGHLGRVDEATKLCEETVALAGARLGPDAPLTLRNQALLALCYSAGRRLQEATRLEEETLERMNAKLGATCPDTLGCMENLGMLYAKAGRNQGAQRLRDEVRLRKAKVGPGQPETSRHVTDDGAEVLPAAVQRDRVIALREETLARLKRELGPDHAATTAETALLARAYRAAGEPDKALPLLERVLDRRTTLRGPDDPNTVVAMNNLAVTYGDARHFDKAIPLMERVVEKSTALHGANHPETLAHTYDLISYYGGSGKLDAVERLSRELLTHRQTLDGLEYPNTAAVLALLGDALLRQHKYVEAEPVLRECLALRETKSPDDWTTFTAKSLLGSDLLAQKKYAEAEPLLVQGYEGLKRRRARITPWVRTLRLAEAAERLVGLYDALGKPDEAARWRRELDGYKKQSAGTQQESGRKPS